MASLIITIGFAVVYQVFTIWYCRKMKFKGRDLAVGGVTCALTLVLSAIIIPIPTGGSISCGSMIPLMLLAVLYDSRLAMISGWICGIWAMLLLPIWQPVHWGQVFVEHLVCFSCLGYAGIFGGENRKKIICGMLIAVAIKFFGHLISGVIFFSQNAWDGWGAWGYSLAYHLSSTLPEGIISMIILLSLPLKSIKSALKGAVKQ
jgi:Predicted membrane protein